MGGGSSREQNSAKGLGGAADEVGGGPRSGVSNPFGGSQFFREDRVRKVGFLLAVLVGVGCNAARAKAIGSEQVPAMTSVAKRPAALTFSRPRFVAESILATPSAGPISDRYTSSDGRSITDVDDRAPQRPAARSVRTASFDPPIPEPLALLLFGSGLFGASGVCVYWASRMKRSEIAAAVSCSG